MNRITLTKKEIATIQACEKKLLKIYRKYETDGHNWTDNFINQVRSISTIISIISDVVSWSYKPKFVKLKNIGTKWEF
jgi:hypothetical protein